MVENEVFVFRLPRRHAPGVLRHSQNFVAIHETVESGVGGSDCFFGERVEIGSGGVELDHGQWIMAGERVVDQYAEQVAIGGRLG